MTTLHVALSALYLIGRLTLALWCKPRLFRCGMCGGSVKAHKLSGIDVPVCVDCGETYLTVERAEVLDRMKDPWPCDGDGYDYGDGGGDGL